MSSPKLLIGVLALIAAAFACGCGGGQGVYEATEPAGTDVASTPSQKPRTAAQIAGAALLSTESLPEGATTDRGVSSVCAPLTIFTQHDGQGAQTPMYRLPSVRVQEAVGAFESKQGAAAALKALATEDRRDCIAGALQLFNGPEVSVGISSSRNIGIGDESAGDRFVVTDPDGGIVGRASALSFRTGRCTATLLFIEKGETTASADIRKTSETAVGLMPSAC